MGKNIRMLKKQRMRLRIKYLTKIFSDVAFVKSRWFEPQVFINNETIGRTTAKNLNESMRRKFY